MYFGRQARLFSLASFNGWSDQIRNLNVDYVEQELNVWCVGVTAIVRVTLQDGSFHENVGFAEAKNQSKGEAMQEAKKVSERDLIKGRLPWTLLVSSVCVCSGRTLRPHSRRSACISFL